MRENSKSFQLVSSCHTIFARFFRAVLLSHIINVMKRLPGFIQDTQPVWTTSMGWTNSGKFFQCLKYKDGLDTWFIRQDQRRTKGRTCLLGIIRLGVLSRLVLRNMLLNGYSSCGLIESDTLFTVHTSHIKQGTQNSLQRIMDSLRGHLQQHLSRIPCVSLWLPRGNWKRAGVLVSEVGEVKKVR